MINSETEEAFLPLDKVYVRWALAEGGQLNIRKWSQFPFDGGKEYSLSDPIFLPSDPTPGSQVVGSEALLKAAEAGWNACRRQVYLLSEDYIERTHPLKATDDTAGNFYRGQYDVAKSFAKAFNAFEARDCDYFKQIDFAALSTPNNQVRGLEAELLAALRQITNSCASALTPMSEGQTRMVTAPSRDALVAAHAAIAKADAAKDSPSSHLMGYIEALRSALKRYAELYAEIPEDNFWPSEEYKNLSLAAEAYAARPPVINVQAIRNAGLKARDKVLERIADGGAVDNDLADYMSHIVEECIRATTATEGE